MSAHDAMNRLQLLRTRILLGEAQKACERELDIALSQRVLGDAESRDRIEAAQQALAAVRANLARINAQLDFSSVAKT